MTIPLLVKIIEVQKLSTAFPKNLHLNETNIEKSDFKIFNLCICLFMFIYDNDRDKIFCLLMIKRKVLKGVDIVEIYGVV